MTCKLLVTSLVRVDVTSEFICVLPQLLFSLHYLLPFVIAAVSLIHLAVLHQDGSGNPLGVNSNVDKISMYPYFIIKDLLGLVVFIIFFSVFIYFCPNLLGHPDNYIEANPMVTPAHIVPE